MSSTLLRFVKRVARPLIPTPVEFAVRERLAQEYLKTVSIPIDRSRPTIVAINHFWDQDLEAIRRANREYNVVALDATRLFRHAAVIYSEPVRLLKDAYESSPRSVRSQYRESCHRLWSQIRSRFGCDLVLVPNDNYFWIREFLDVARDEHVPIVMWHKEGTLSPFGYTFEAHRSRTLAPCQADYVLVWSDRHREFWRTAGVPADRIRIVGQPRSDLLYDTAYRVDWSRLFPTEQPLVTLLSYFDDAYIPPEFVQQGMSWRQMKTESHDLLARAAELFPEWNFVIKTHPQQRDTASLERRYHASNLRVVGGAQLGTALIKASSLVIAFQTTALIEAVCLGKRVIYTNWDPHLETLRDHLLPFEQGSGYRIIDSAQEYHTTLHRFLSGDLNAVPAPPTDDTKRQELVSAYLHQPDGQVAARFFDIVDEVLS